jgi:hypothetical protein
MNADTAIAIKSVHTSSYIADISDTATTLLCSSPPEDASFRLIVEMLSQFRCGDVFVLAFSTTHP